MKTAIKATLIVLGALGLTAHAQSQPDHAVIQRIKAECSDQSLNVMEHSQKAARYSYELSAAHSERRDPLWQGEGQFTTLRTFSEFHMSRLELAKTRCLHGILIAHFKADADLDGLHILDSQLLQELRALEQLHMNNRSAAVIRNNCVAKKGAERAECFKTSTAESIGDTVLAQAIGKLEIERVRLEGAPDGETLGEFSESALKEIADRLAAAELEIRLMPANRDNVDPHPDSNGSR